MPEQNRIISPGVRHLIMPELQDYLWAIHSNMPLSPSIFDLRRGKGKGLHIQHISLCPFYEKKYYTVQISQPVLDDIRITVLRIDTGWLMRLSNRQLETQYGKMSGPEQGFLF